MRACISCERSMIAQSPRGTVERFGRRPSVTRGDPEDRHGQTHVFVIATRMAHSLEALGESFAAPMAPDSLDDPFIDEPFIEGRVGADRVIESCRQREPGAD